MPFGLGMGEMLLMLVMMALPLLLVVLPGWRIAEKAGYPGALSLLLLVPLVNIATVFAFAFSTWPLERRAGVSE